MVLPPGFKRVLFVPGCRLLAATLLMATGNGVWGAEPQITLSANQLNFPAQIQETASAPQVVVVTNNGEADLSITGITISGENSADFVQTNNCPIAPGVLAPRTRCEIRVTFSPTVTGTLSAALNVADNASGSPQTVSLKGVSTAPGPVVSLVPSSLAFGNQPQGTSSAVQMIALTNAGSGTLNINSEISINGPASGDFHIQAIKNSCPLSTFQLARKTSCYIGVVFASATLGVKSAQILIMDDAPGSPHSIQLSGTGTPQQNIPKSEQ
ncbi:MAG: choice-of-anchor D domain-containing protein [Candidatus Acidiferrales bacterium]